VNGEELTACYEDEQHVLEALEDEPGPVSARLSPVVSHSIQFSRELVQHVRSVAAREGVGVTQMMRDWIEEGLAEAEN
jgi:hypothetical protein